MFARRGERTLGVTELNELMLDAQATAYADGLDQSTAHPYMWVLKPHYYSRTSTTGRTPTACCSASGCSPATARIPSASASGYETLLSRAGMDTAEELGAAFGLDVTDEAFWIGQPRRDPCPHRRLRAPRRRARLTTP